MYIRILAIIALLSYVPGYALEYTHIDGTHVSVDIPSSLNEATKKTIESEIQKIFPPETTPNIMEIHRIDTNFLNLDTIIDTAHWEHSIDVKNIYSDSSITSVLITSYEYTGGAHGSMARIGLVMDTKTGKKLSLADFYNTDKLTKKLSPIWQNQIALRLKKILGQELTIDDKNWIRDGSNDIQQYQSFTLTPRMLVIYGQQYQHNAYAYGMQTLTYPRSRLIDIIK